VLGQDLIEPGPQAEDLVGLDLQIRGRTLQDTRDQGLEIEAHEILRLRARLYEILAKHTGQTAQKIEKDCDRNLWLDSEEVIQYGLADRILQKAPEIVKDAGSVDRGE